MKRLALTIATLCTAIAPAAYAQNYYKQPSPSDPSYVAPNPDWDNNGNTGYDNGPVARDDEWRDNHARVLEVRPMYAAGTTHQECWNEESHRYEHSRINPGTVLGAVVGGVLGHQVGSGRGNDVATAGGAILGGVIGNNVDGRHEERENAPSDSTRCRTVSDSNSNVTGYYVRYEYQGRDYTARMDHQPGEWLTRGRDIRDDGSPFDANVAANAPEPRDRDDYR